MTQTKPPLTFPIPIWPAYMDICIGEVPLLRVKGRRKNPIGPLSPDNMTPDVLGAWTEFRVTVGYDDANDYQIVAIDVIGDQDMNWTDVDRDQPLYALALAAIEADKDALATIDEAIEDRLAGRDQ